MRNVNREVCQQVGSLIVDFPSQQVLPNQECGSNPFYDFDMNKSYWTYKVMSILDQTDPQITDVYIPIYSNINDDMLVVEESIVACNETMVVPFDFSSPPGILPPEGYKFIHVSVNRRYLTSNCVFYRLTLVGNYPKTNQDIYLQTEDSVVGFDTGLPVPSPIESPAVTINKEGQVNIIGNSATIDYTVRVMNTGNEALSDLMFTDRIDYTAFRFSFGTIIVEPDTINVDTSRPGVIELSGNLGTLGIGEMVTITYTVPLTGFTGPGNYIFNSMTMVMNDIVQGAIDTQVMVPVVQLESVLSCEVTSVNEINFNLQITNLAGSPDTMVSFTMVVIVTGSVTAQFQNFGRCRATLSGTESPVLPNTNITGRSVTITCNFFIPATGILNQNIPLLIVSGGTPAPNLSVIPATLNTVRLQEENEQVFIGAGDLPQTRVLDIGYNTICSENNN